MLRRILSLLFFMLISLTLSAGRCAKCHGSGRITVFPAVSHYGVDEHKKQCPYCGKWVYSGHKCTCPACGGTGQSSNSKSDYSSGSDNLDWDGFTGEERDEIEMLSKRLMSEEVYYPVCSVCNGTRLCQVCKNGPNEICPCGGSFECVACNGTGYSPYPQYKRISEEESERIQARIREISQRAQKRAIESSRSLSSLLDDSEQEVTNITESDDEEYDEAVTDDDSPSVWSSIWSWILKYGWIILIIIGALFFL